MEKLKGCLCSRRYTLAFLGFGLLFFGNAIRDSMSVAIVCMAGEDVETINTHNDTYTNLSSNDTHHGRIAEQGENQFNWDKTERSIILSMFFAGFFLSTFLGLWILKHDIIRYYMGGGMMIAAIATLILPFCMTLDIRLIYPLRIIMGLSVAIIFPGLQSMWGRWAPQTELTKLCTITYSGRFVGTVFAFCLTGIFCSNLKDGWKVIFYLVGGMGLAWFVIWQLLTSHSPQTDPYISTSERNFIVANIAINHEQKVPVPWKSLLLSRPVWCCLMTHMMCDWLDYSLTTNGPTYLDEVLHFNIAQNGVLSAVPHLSRAVCTPLVGQLGAVLIKRKLLGIRAARRVFQTVATLGSAACLIGLGFVSRDQRPLAIVLLACAFSLQAFSESAYQVNEVEIAPRYSGIISGMGNSMSGIAGVLAPIITGIMTPNKTQAEWRNNFLVVVGLNVVAWILFLIFLETDVQPWAKGKGRRKPSVCHVAKFGTEADEGKAQDAST